MLRSLLDMHHDREAKLAGGVKAIVAREHHQPFQGRQRCFYIVHDDDSETSFTVSNPGAYSSRLYDKDAAMGRALRDYMQPVMSAYKNANFNGVCELTGQKLSWNDAVVDHSGEWPFSRIVREWIAVTRADKSFAIDTNIGLQMKPKWGEHFHRFHDERARLRIISRSENSKIGARGR